MPISLPTKPKGEEYEDLGVAFLKTAGFFTETHLTLREDQREILELDAIASANPMDNKERYLFEMKKDGFSFGNLFKLYGQRKYLDIDKACYMSLKGTDPSQEELFRSKAEELDIDLCHLALDENGNIDLDDSSTIVNLRNDLEESLRGGVISSTWYQEIAKRVTSQKFIRKTKAEEREIFEHARIYDLKVSTSQFKPKPLKRAEALYQAYFDAPDRIIQCFVELISERKGFSEVKIWNQIKDGNVNEIEEYNYWLQYLMWLQHYARITIIKNALQHSLIGECTSFTTIRIGDYEISLPEGIVPSSFWDGLQALGENNYYTRLPYLFQIFIDIFGGFIFHKKNDELKFIEKFTGIPADEIVDCLYILDEFFAPPGGTWYYTQGDQLLCMKMVPCFIKGGGCFLRKQLYGIEDYSEEFSPLDWLLRRWHNATYNLLEPYLSNDE